MSQDREGHGEEGCPECGVPQRWSSHYSQGGYVSGGWSPPSQEPRGQSDWGSQGGYQTGHAGQGLGTEQSGHAGGYTTQPPTAPSGNAWFPPQDARQGRTGGRPPKNYRRSDERLSDEVHESLSRTELDLGEVEVRVQEGVVTLTGSVPDKLTRRHAEDIVARMRHVQDVVNALRLGSRRPSDEGSAAADEQGFGGQIYGENAASGETAFASSVSDEPEDVEADDDDEDDDDTSVATGDRGPSTTSGR